ncbi:MAG TPA: radical SAM protein [Bacteroidales bacterium]|nr:radical SAM protein [Bacteroidales bacterium]
MSTFLFNEIIFGPVRSRRLGVSLGINLLPVNRKVCNFNCVYCECGWTGDIKNTDKLPSREEVRKALDDKLAMMKEQNNKPDIITYAGNGEPTLHPEFPGIIDDSIELRNKYFPEAEIAVLSNSTRIKDPLIRDALLKVDKNILKLDSVFRSSVMAHNRPLVNVDVEQLISDLSAFKGKVIIQTLFLRGTYDGKRIDNTTPEEIEGWLKAIGKIRPQEVMIYTISRDTPHGAELEKVPATELKGIADAVRRLGIKTRVSA